MAPPKSKVALTPANFARSIKNREQGSLYALVGKDSITIDAIFKFLKDEFIEAGTEDFNLEVIYGNSVSAGEIISAAETMPFMGGFRLVWVRHAEEMSADDFKVLNDYLDKVVESPREDLLLILCFESLDLRIKFAKALNKEKLVVNCEIGQLKDPNKVAQEKYSKSFTPDAEQLFVSLIGQNARIARNELEKLCLFLGDREVIKAEDVLNVCADNSTRNEWELANQLLKGDFPKMIEFLSLLRESNIDPIFLHTIITMTISKMALPPQAFADGSMGRRLRLSPYSQEFSQINENLKTLSNQKMINALRFLMFSEIAVKGSSLPKKVLADLACFLVSNEVVAS